MMGIIEAYSDRSTCVTHQKCPRLRWWQHEFPNTTNQPDQTNQPDNLLLLKPDINAPGVVLNKLNMDTTLGSAFHVGIYHLLNGVRLDEAVGRVLEGDGDGWEGFWPMVKKTEFQLGDMEDAGYVYFEQAALAEALVRGYYYYALPKLLDIYEVLETEYDEHSYFSDQSVPDFRLRWGIRTDALLRDKSTDALFILSLKTAKEWRRTSEENNRTDMQGLTEMGAVEQRLGRWQEELVAKPEWLKGTNPDHLNKGGCLNLGGDVKYGTIPAWFIQRFLNGADPLVAGVKMEFALKGYRSEYPKGSGQFKYSNPLIRPYRRAEDGMMIKRRGTAGNHVSGEYAIQWDFKDPMDGSNHTLGKGWRVTNIWEDMGVRNWIEYCLENDIQGFPAGYAIEKQFVLPVEYNRNPDDVKRKVRQLVNQEWRVDQGRKAVLEALMNRPEDYIEQLDIHFPQQQDFPHSCSYCGHKTICLGPDSYKFNPLSHPSFVARTPNHGKAELVQIEA